MERHPATQLQPVVPLRPAAKGLSLSALTSLLTLTALSLALLAWRLRITGRSGHLSTGTTDLWLAWAPVPLAWLVARLAAADNVRYQSLKTWGMWIAAAVWLLFFPNSPYLITELLHLDSTGDFGPSNSPAPQSLHFLIGDGPFEHRAPAWLDLILLVTVAATGVLLTFASLQLIHGAIGRRLSRRPAGAVMCLLILLASFGVSIGRFVRLNSWYAFSRPSMVFDQVATLIVHPYENMHATATTFVFAVLIGIGYFRGRDFAPPHRL